MMLKKFVSTIIYGLAFIPITLGSLIMAAWQEGMYIGNGHYTANMLFENSERALFMIIIIPGGLILFLINFAMQKFEAQNSLTMLDHFRQSLIYYFYLICYGLLLFVLFTGWAWLLPDFFEKNYVINEQYLPDKGAELLMVGAIVAGYAILINFIFVIYKRRQKSQAAQGL